ncbi:ABC transporter permease [Actinopolymorpha rutila]|uniref:Putative ABC transport system permease protein n=1 Tax=Actinopolymorpha rutila TaxID=446787 RepID=A0A852ZD20_9ACTN|nr:ABC transporter permease [Actinopolymorpha rutila]NYH90203.1 putative ABC transport system permease protein [Actinopolymorpha rutila]
MRSVGLGPATLVLLPVLAGLAALLSRLGGLGHQRALPLAVGRAIVQLAAVGLVVGFALSSYAGTLAFLVLMAGVATFTSGRRLRGLPDAWARAGAAIVVPATPVLVLLLLTRSVPANPATLLPLGGILVGGAMSATTLAGRRVLAELRGRWGEVEAAMTVGLTPRQAYREIAGRAGADALLPALDQTRTVGLVTLPGTFVGMVLGGASPLRAAAFQLVVLVCLLAVEAASIVLVTELVAAAAPFPRPAP